MGLTNPGVIRISGSDSTFSGTVRITGGPNITVGTDASGITMSGAAVGGAQTGISSIAASDTTYTSGGVTITGSNAITVRSTTGQGIVIDMTQSVQTQDIGSMGVSTGGNTAGNTTVNTGSRMVFAGMGSITLSQATAAGASTISISGSQTVQTQDVLSAGVSTGGNTAGNTTVNTGSRMVFVGMGAATLSQTTGAGASTISISVPTQSVQTQDVLSAGVSTAGNTAGNTTVNTGSRMVIVGSNNITLSQATAAGASTITILGANFPAETQTAISGVAASNTTYTSGTITITGVGGGITVQSNTGQRVDLSVAAQSVQTQDVLSAGVSTGGNTAGNTTVNTGSRLVFAGGANITLSQDTAAGASTINIVGPSPGAAQYSIGVSTGGNTAGATGVTGTRIVFVGTNNISLSQTTDANGATISINQTGGGGGGLASAGFSTQGNTSGNTSMASSVMQLVGGNNITLSGGTAAGNVTITISAPNTTNIKTYSHYDPTFGEQIVEGQQGQASLHMQPMWAVPDLQFNRIVFPVRGSNATNSTCSNTLSMWIGFYTRNASTLSLVSSFSTSQGATWSGTANSTVMSGPKLFTMGATMTLTADDYWVGIVSRTTSGGANMSISQYLISIQNSNLSGFYGSVSNTSNQYKLGQGLYTATTAGMPASVAFSQLSGTQSIALRPPKVYFLSGSA